MTEQQQRNLRVGDIVHTAHGNYLVAAVESSDATPVLVRCFRMRDFARYQNGFRPSKAKRRARSLQDRFLKGSEG